LCVKFVAVQTGARSVAHCRLNCIARLPMFSRLRLAGESVAAANRERAAYDKLADDRKIVTSVATEDAAKQVPYWLQADPSLNTESALLQRMGLRRHFKVREAVDLWWSTALATLTDAEMPMVRPLSSSSNLPRGQRWNASSKDIVWAIEQRHEAQPQPQQRGGGGAGTADVPASSAAASSSSSSSGGLESNGFLEGAAGVCNHSLLEVRARCPHGRPAPLHATPSVTEVRAGATGVGNVWSTCAARTFQIPLLPLCVVW
jgi:hypothetical protein